MAFDNQQCGKASPGSPLIKLKGVVKTYWTFGTPVTALKGIDLDVAQGEYLVVTGKSGAGKTTLVNLIAGLDRCTAGTLWVASAPLHQLKPEAASKWRGRQVGVVFQNFELLPSLSILQNVMLPMDFSHTFPPSQARERALSLLAEVEIADHAQKLPSTISGGQQQRVAIARALANDPPLILADEPTGSLDSVTSEAVLKMFERLVERGKTVLIVSHDPDIAARAQRVITLHDGQITNDRRKG
ncbi:MAG TPA: ABC transporter ATP-binding protein [Anaerolineaceae bacterium]